MPNISQKVPEDVYQAFIKAQCGEVTPKCHFCGSLDCADIYWSEEYQQFLGALFIHKSKYICHSCHNTMNFLGLVLFNPIIESLTFLISQVRKICHF
jgi:hypothetical protein